MRSTVQSSSRQLWRSNSSNKVALLCRDPLHQQQQGRRRAAKVVVRGDATATAAAAPPSSPSSISAKDWLQTALASNPALSAVTPVTEVRSPEDVVKAKAAELAAIGPGGLPAAARYAAFAPLVWGAAAAGSAGTLARAALSPPPAAAPEWPAPPFAVEEFFVEGSGGVRLHCVSPGRRPGKPLMLFLHGFPELWYSWRYQMAAFAEDYDVVAINQRGYSKSDRPQDTSSYRLECLTADVVAAIKALGHERCHALVAHDWGGSVAWATAGMHGSKLFDRLIVMALPHTGVALTNVDGEQRRRSSYVLLFQARGLAEALLTADGGAAMDACFRTGPAAVRNTGALTEADVEYYRANILQPGGATAMLRWYRAFMRTLTLADQPGDAAVWSALRARIDVPTLVLHADDDIALGPQLLNGAEAAFAAPVEIKMLAKCSHWIQMDYPAQVNALVRDWLGRQDRAAGKQA